MIEFDVDMGYLLEEQSLDRIVLNDENGEHEPIEFVPKSNDEAHMNEQTERTCRLGEEVGALTILLSGYNDCAWRWCPECNGATPEFSNYCLQCGAKVVQ